MSIGERITNLRKAKNISQCDLARAMDVSRQAVSKWENDVSCPDALNLIKLSEFLDTNIEYLSTGREVFPTRPPVVITTVETVEKIVEKPVVQVVEKVVERKVEVPVERIVEVPVVEYVEKPVIRKVTKYKYLRNPMEYLALAAAAFLLGLLIGRLI